MKAPFRYWTSLFSVLAFLFTIHVSALTPESTRQWIEDLDYLVARLEVMHPNLYANISKEAFTARVDELKKRIPDMTDLEVVYAIHEMTGQIRDLHTGVIPWRAEGPEVTKYFDAYPLMFYPFSDGVFVMAASKEHARIVGAKVLKFGDMPADNILKTVMEQVSGDNCQSRLSGASIQLSLAGALAYAGVQGADRELTLTLQGTDKEVFLYTMKPLAFMDALPLVAGARIGHSHPDLVFMNGQSEVSTPTYLLHPNDNYWYTWLPELKAVYVSLIEMQPKSAGDFDRFYAEVLRVYDEKQAEKLILDVRFNTGGDHFELPLMKGVIARPELDREDRLFILQGRTTGSASQHFVTQFSLYTNATFIGEDTGGKANHYGAMRVFKLPNSGLPIRSSIIYHQDDADWNMEETAQPDIYSTFSSEDFRNNHDPTMEVIANYDEYAAAMKTFSQQMETAYKEGGIPALERVYQGFCRDFGHLHLNMENLVIGFSWWLSPNAVSRQDYAAYMGFYADHFPHSTRAWYSLARQKQLAGDIKAAIACYEKSLVCNPGNVIARRRLNLIRFDQRTRPANQ